jgi:mono/diheme cytochrome c family protein
MAASDKHYRSQKILDYVFAASCVVMLGSIFWMLYDDYAREFRVVQRKFRDVETDLSERQMLTSLPEPENIQEIIDLDKQIRTDREALAKIKDGIKKKLDQLLSEKGKLVLEQLGTKADLDSENSLYNIAVNEDVGGINSPKAKKIKDKIAVLEVKYDEITRKVDAKQAEIDNVLSESGAKEKEADIAKQEDRLKKLTSDFDRLAKLTSLKRWKWDDYVRSLPILDGFAPPSKIQQITLKELTIDYGGFSNVTRYDRCTTCHLAVDRANYDRASLTALASVPDGLPERLRSVKRFIKEREGLGAKLNFDPTKLPDRVRTTKLSPGEVTQFCAHPRLDLFIDPNSKHPVEQFGCTICHAGQGSATEFGKAAHVPATTKQQKSWEDEYRWERERDWDFPMLSSRFLEATCVKCHHNITDLISKDNREEAPKLLKGYNLVKDNGCFGCHEIAAIKSGREIGPDLRLEPYPPLEALTAEEQVKLKSDPLNPPGTFRKVGPSLYRLVEKTNPDWTRKWITSPRGFRPNTKMPHFYGLSTNNTEVLPEDQKEFPDAEIASITHYLFETSDKYLQGKDIYRVTGEARVKQLEELKSNNLIGDKQSQELILIQRRLELTKPPVPLAKQIVDENGHPVELPPEVTEAKAKEEEQANGRRLFTERGCLACHAHEGTTKAKGSIPAVVSEQHFGPNLSRVAAKIVPATKEKDAKRRWIVQWLLDPNVHSPRTKMPSVHLTVEQASQIGAWLLSQPVEEDEEYKAWNESQEAPDLKTLIDLTRVYLSKAPRMTRRDVDAILGRDGGTPAGLTEEQIKDLGITPESDEYALQGELNEIKLQWYIGKKSIGRLGCYGCHNIPGFETAKPIGTALNDWGKKDPERLAFEDIVRFVNSTYNIVVSRDDAKDKTRPSKEWKSLKGKKPYEKYFFEALDHHQRDGFLNQKLIEPRSYDYGRLRTWDDRLRMPQFKFAETKRLEDESDDAFEARALKDEAESREAVMTFILGLVADPIPLKYVYQPSGDRLAQVKGVEVLEKYNCAGCHQVRPGVIEYKLSDQAQKLLARSYNDAAKKLPEDFYFRFHNAWDPVPQPTSDRLLIHGVNPREGDMGLESDDDDKKVAMVRLRLSQAIRTPVIAKKGDDDSETETKTVDIPASADVSLLKGNILSSTKTFGGTFANMMVNYVIALDPNSDKRALREGNPVEADVSTARSWLPPPLEREGERVQPGWLFNFLRNPQPIRPTAKMMLRMPRFNMSDEEATNLVNYFAGTTRLENPGIGLVSPFVTIKEQDDLYWQNQTRNYVARLGKDKVAKKAEEMRPVWLARAEEQRSEIDRRIKAAQAALPMAKTDEDKTRLTKEIADLEKTATTLKDQIAKKDFSEFRKQWEEKEIYALDAYRLLAHPTSPCLGCHQVGNVPAQEAKGPPLEISFDRLRPGWTQEWLANPRRLFPYDPIMPQNFPRGSNNLPELFDGDALQKVTAIRDVLMNWPKIADMPGIHNR